MARRPRNLGRSFRDLIEKLEPDLQAAFEAAVADLRAGVNYSAFLDALERQDIEGAVRALNIEPAAWEQYRAVKTAAYAQGGTLTAATMPVIPGVPGTRFNMGNPRAEAWIAENVGREITNEVQEQITLARTSIQQGYAAGQHPHAIARDLVGRVNRASGLREGGSLGLDAPRADRLAKVSAGMRTPEGVQDLVIRHKDGTLSVRYKVNSATEARILRAYRAGTEVPEADRLISERQYSNALHKARAQSIAHTETAQAVMSARDEEWLQLVEARGLDENAVIKTWQHRRGAKEGRPDHIAMSGVSVRGLRASFVMADGTQMLHSHDPAGGAKHNVLCGCDTTYRLDRAAGLK